MGQTTARTSIRSRLAAALGSALIVASLVATISPVLADPASPLQVTKTANPSPVTSGGQLTYTISMKNTGGAKVDTVVMTDQVNGVGTIQTPPGLPQLTITSTQGPCTQGGANGNVVTCQIGTIAGQGSVTVTIRGQVTAARHDAEQHGVVTGTKSAQNFTTNASVSGAGPGRRRRPAPDLTLNKTGPTSVAPARTMTYTLTVNNLGSANTANVKVVDTLPAGVTLQASPFETTSLFGCRAAGTNPITVICTGGAVNAGPERHDQDQRRGAGRTGRSRTPRSSIPTTDRRVQRAQQHAPRPSTRTSLRRRRRRGLDHRQDRRQPRHPG